MTVTAPPIALVRPGCLSPADLQQLRDAGYVVVESNHADAVRVMSALELPLDPLRVAEAAFIASGSHSVAVAKFGETLLRFIADDFKKKSGEVA